ncbi:hypothetical protein P153DRAFT_371493 [Dothidotthia symphoricarpi CBS 119687]|uniref:DUF7924 domain-containing protein n=1 Tax=Dothidotthia symphoricarpi CBS 119687 TaxID=1392245 RepID=A0A6A5ZVX6_9PLEO|nr:uncharacterized protein P153DRAFT_371493 [Dothidotthia symphoricarpi CBS 119687]KAF2123679.1 hypothetical protein P153DRAFT_371493 [Dothidotthia symphoricarpi CBS 119687]
MIRKRAHSEDSHADCLPAPAPKRQKPAVLPHTPETLADSHSSPAQPKASPSSPHASPSLPHAPLTHENLRKWEQSIASSTQPKSRPPMTGSTTSDGGSSTTVDERAKLEAYGIFPTSDAALPPLLDTHVIDVIRRARDGPLSPAARLVARNQKRAQAANEATGISYLAPHLLFLGEADDGEPYVHRVKNCNLNRQFLPSAPDAFIHAQVGKLSQPQPDDAIGYIPVHVAASSDVTNCPLTRDEEAVIMRDLLTPDLHFPFLTCQWKSAKGRDKHWHAMHQSARDGAAIINHLHAFYTEAGISPSVVDTCHFSLTCDFESAYLFVHWREDDQAKSPTYHMKKIEQSFLRDLHDPNNPTMVCLRGRLRNILDFALGPRLDRIKATIPILKAVKAQKRARVSPTRRMSKMSHTTASDQGYGGSINLFTGTPSLPPPSPTTSPDPKRRRC